MRTIEEIEQYLSETTGNIFHIYRISDNALEINTMNSQYYGIRIINTDRDGIIIDSCDGHIDSENFAKFMDIDYVSNKYILSKENQLEAILMYFS